MQTLFRTTAILAAALVPTIAAAGDLPRYYQVTDVDSDDVLNVRMEPDAGAQIIDGLAPGTGPVEITGTDGTGGWGRAPWGDTDGWMAMRYLAEVSPETFEDTTIPVGLQCHGNEPFWGFHLAAERIAIMNDMGIGETALVIEDAGPATDNPEALARFKASGQGMTVTADIGARECSDTMSDATYGYGVTLNQEADGAIRVYSGCCTLRLQR